MPLLPLAIALLAPPAAAHTPERVAVEVYTSILSADADGSYRIGLGTHEGVIDGDRGTLWRLDDDGDLARVGSLVVELVRAEEAWVRVVPGAGMGAVRGGDVVQLTCEVPWAATDQLTFDLNRNGLWFQSWKEEPLYHLAYFVDEPDGDLDSSMAAWLPIDTRKKAGAIARHWGGELEPGRFDAHGTLKKAIKNATADDALAFLYFAQTEPEGWQGRAIHPGILFGWWIMKGGPVSAGEHAWRVEPLDAEARAAYFREHQAQMDEWEVAGEWYEESGWLSTLHRHTEAHALVDLMFAYAEVTGDPADRDAAFTARAEAFAAEDRYDDAIATYRDALAHVADRPDRRLSLLTHMGDLAERFDRTDEAVGLYEEAMADEAIVALDPMYPGRIWEWIGDALYHADREDEALPAYDRALALSRANGPDRAAEVRLLDDIADSHYWRQRYGEALTVYLEALAVAETGPEDAITAQALDQVCTAYNAQNHYANAVGYCEREYAVWLAVGDELEGYEALEDVAAMQSHLGRQDEALDALERARAFHEPRFVAVDTADVLARLADVHATKGDHAEALALLDLRIEVLNGIADHATLADAHADRATRLLALARLADADLAFAAGLEHARAAGEGEAAVLESWGYALYEQKRSRDAATKLEEALAMRIASGDRVGEATTRLALSSLYSGWLSDPATARAHAEAALQIGVELPSKQIEAKARTRMAAAWSDTDTRVALTWFEEAAALYAEIGDRYGEAQTMQAIANIQDELGDRAGAFARYEQALALSREIGDAGLVAQCLSSMGWLHLAGAEHEAARVKLDEAMALAEQSQQPSLVAGVWTARAELEYDSGDYSAAFAAWDAAIAIRREWSDPWGLVQVLLNSAGAYTAVGQPDRAIANIEEARPITVEMDWVIGRIAADGMAASAYIAKKDLDTALLHAQAAAALSLEADLPDYITGTKRIVGRIHRERGDLDLAREELLGALEVAKRVDLPTAVVRTETELGIVAYEQGDAAAARKRLTDAADRARRIRAVQQLWEPLFWLGRTERDAERNGPAIAAYQEAVDVLEQLGSTLAADKEAREAFMAERGDVYRELVDLLMQARREDDAFRVLAQMKSQELDGLTRGGPKVAAATPEEREAAAEIEALRTRQRELERLVREELAKPSKTQQAALVAGWKAELDTLQLQFQDYARQLEKAHPDLFARLQIAPPSFYKLRADLAPNEAFLEPIVLPDRVVLFLVRGGDAPLLFRETRIAEAEVDGLVRAMRSSLDQPSVEWTPVRGVKTRAAAGAAASGGDPMGPAQRLYDLVVAPVREDLVGIDTLVVSPSGRLRYVPFAALHSGERYLVQDYELAMLTQSGALAEHATLDRTAPLLALGNPDGSLPGAEAEVATLAGVWGRKTEIFVGAAATKGQLKQVIGNHRIVHLATHGFLLSESPEESYLLLAGDGPESKLTFREIPLLALDDVDLAVLSACETAVGDNGEGAEIAGLAYQFEMRGAASVIASLWAVNDASTSALMTTFYGALQKPGTAKADALRQAQLALIADPDRSHPYYWAPFVLIGDWR